MGKVRERKQNENSHFSPQGARYYQIQREFLALLYPHLKACPSTSQKLEFLTGKTKHSMMDILQQT